MWNLRLRYLSTVGIRTPDAHVRHQDYLSCRTHLCQAGVLVVVFVLALALAKVGQAEALLIRNTNPEDRLLEMQAMLAVI